VSATTISEGLQRVISDAVLHEDIGASVAAMAATHNRGLSASNIINNGSGVISSSGSYNRGGTSRIANNNAQDDNAPYVPFLYPFVTIPYLLESLQKFSNSYNGALKNFLTRLKCGDSSVSLDLVSHFSVIPCGVKNSQSQVDDIRNGGSIESDIFRFYATNEYCFKRGFAYQLDKMSKRYDFAIFKTENTEGVVVLQPARIFGIIRIVEEDDNLLNSKKNTESVNAHNCSTSSFSRRSTKTISEKTSERLKKAMKICGDEMCLTADKRQKLDKQNSYRREVLKPNTIGASRLSYKEEDNDIILLICWLVEDKKERRRSAYPYPYYQYDTIKDGNQKVIYTQIVRPGCLYLPLYAIHDVDTKPDYEFEGSSMAAMLNDRFWGFPFELFRKLRRQYFGSIDFDFLFSSTAVNNSGVFVDEALAESDKDDIEEVKVAEDSELLTKKTNMKNKKIVALASKSKSRKCSNKSAAVHDEQDEEEEDESDGSISIGLGNSSDEDDDDIFSDGNEVDDGADDG
jgi:hypothetical protein